MNKTVISSSAEETQSIGESFAKTLKKGGLIYLTGQLGSGKTTFVQGVARGLGVTQRIISPTFVLVREHKTKHSAIQRLFHVDLYRIANNSHVEGLNFTEMLNNDTNLVLVEWPDRVTTLPKSMMNIYLTQIDDMKREIKFI